MIQLIFALLGIGAGYSFMPMIWSAFNVSNRWLNNIFIDMVIGLLVFVVLGILLIDPVERLVQKVEKFFLTNLILYVILSV